MRTKGPGESALLLLDVLGVLGTQQIEYAVVGAMAASVHGAVRASLDADAALSVAPPLLRTLEREFAAAGFRTECRFGDLDDRPQDIADANCAARVVREELDLHLLRRIAQRYGRETVTALDRLIADIARP